MNGVVIIRNNEDDCGYEMIQIPLTILDVSKETYESINKGESLKHKLELSFEKTTDQYNSIRAVISEIYPME